MSDGGIGLIPIKTKYHSMKLNLLYKNLKNMLPLSKQLIEKITKLEDKRKISPIFYIKINKERYPKLLGDSIPLLKKLNLSVEKGTKKQVTTNDLMNAQIYANEELLNGTLKMTNLIAYKANFTNDLTHTQIKWKEEFNLEYEKIWNIIKKVKCRPRLKSFFIKVWNNCAFLPEICQLCKSMFTHRQVLQHFLFECDDLNSLYLESNFPSFTDRLDFFKNPTKKNLISCGIYIYSSYKLLMKNHFEEDEAKPKINSQNLLNLFDIEMDRHMITFA